MLTRVRTPIPPAPIAGFPPHNRRMRSFDSLSEREILALAVSLEEEDERIYGDFADGLRENYPATADMFEGMRQEESGHRRRLIELHQARFGDHLPLIRRQDVKGFVNRKPVWLMRPLPLEIVRRQAASMELETRNFYLKAAARATDAGIRQLLDDLAQEERAHEDRAEALGRDKLSPGVRHPGRHTVKPAATCQRLCPPPDAQVGPAHQDTGDWARARDGRGPWPVPPSTQTVQCWQSSRHCVSNATSRTAASPCLY